MGVEAGEGGEQRGVNVERGVGAVEERRREHAHVAVEADEVELVVSECRQDTLLVRLTRLLFVPLDSDGWDASLLGSVQHGGVGVVRDDDREFGAAGCSVRNV